MCDVLWLGGRWARREETRRRRSERCQSRREDAGSCRCDATQSNRGEDPQRHAIQQRKPDAGRSTSSPAVCVKPISSAESAHAATGSRVGA